MEGVAGYKAAVGGGRGGGASQDAGEGLGNEGAAVDTFTRSDFTGRRDNLEKRLGQRLHVAEVEKVEDGRGSLDVNVRKDGTRRRQLGAAHDDVR